MSIILETIQSQKSRLSKKQTVALTQALQVVLTDVLDKSLVFGYNMGKDGNDIKKVMAYTRRTFTTNI